jgi:shikimate kinase
MKVIFLIGKGGVGKSTYAKKLMSDKIVHLDEIIRPKFDPADMVNYAFDVYRPIREGNEEYIISLKEWFVKRVREEFIGHNIVICEGAVEDPEIIEKICAGYERKVLYLSPASKDFFLRNMISRVKKDIQDGTKTMSVVWNRMSPEETDDLLNKTHGGKLFDAFIDELAKDRFRKRFSPLAETQIGRVIDEFVSI